MKKITRFRLFSCLLIFFCLSASAQRGKDGAKTVSSSVIVNEYTPVQANATAGSTTLTVANSSLNANGYFSGPLAPGDLIFIIQLQGASMGLNNDSTYGVINLYNNCGNNEFAQVSSVPNATTIVVDCGLRNSYTATGRVQVVRVPRWSTLTINSGGSITCPGWSVSTGGVVAFEVLGNTVINSGGSIDATGKGFRGGALDNQSQFGTYDYRWNTPVSGAEKGEGIAGNQGDYDNFSGRYDRGAPANGGGGGNGHTAGGGGGANAGNVAGWNGYGIPDVSTGSWATAWNLEWSGFASNNSSGGGRGGYSYSSDDRNALSEGPGNTNWGGDYRRNVGGIGGRPMDYSTGRLFLGGGGGSGDQNQNKGGAGGNGGGLIYVMSFADVTGAGQVVSKGANGQSTPARGTDGAGGAGGGGTIVINATGTVSGITINADGGNGGNQIIRNVFEPTEAEGPGGGGGGGYIAVTNGTPARSANGGTNGVTDSGGLLEFPPNGATKGGPGLPTASIPWHYLTATGDTVCPGFPATLSATVLGTAPPGTSYKWYTSAVGGSSIGTGSTFITPAISVPTTYYVEICPGFYRVAVQVSVHPVPVPNFTFTTTCLGQVTNFTNTSTGGTSYSWNFGDGNTSTQTNPNHTYASAGSFSVSLIATNSFGCTDTLSQTVTVGTTPQVSFSAAGNTTGCGSLTVNFNNTTTGGGANTYAWNFGDGGTSSQQNPSHTYNTPGTYTVTLSATLGNCNDVDSIVNYITVNPVPTAAFTASNVCLGDVVNFINTSSGATSYNWNFGDGIGTSTQQSPSYTYGSANTFTVSLIVSNGTCTDTITQNVTVNNAPQVSFTSSGATTGCGPMTVTFVNNTTGGGGNNYTWNFGDGGTSTQQNPSHTYSIPGTYTVTLSAVLGSCSDADSIVNYITVNPSPTANFSATGVCLGNAVNFTNTSAGASTYNWNFGDGIGTSTQFNPSYTYTSANTFTVTLIVSNGTCTDTVTQSVTVSNTPQVSFSTAGATTGCGSLTVNFSNTTTGGFGTTYSWNFGDGGTSTQQNPSHTYSSPGTYTVTLAALLGSCSDADSIVNYITVNPLPTAAFSASNVCLGDVMSFTNSSSGATIYSWDFGDGIGTSAQSNPSYTYSSANTFTVTLIASDGTCADTLTQNVTVNNAPQVSFTTSGATAGCEPFDVAFINNTTGGGGNNYTWNFGDGGTSTQQNPSHTFLLPGTYTVTLSATLGSCSDADSIVNYITVNSSPVAGFSASNVCLGDVMNFTNSSSGATNYSWDFGDGIGTSIQSNPSYTYSSANTFTVTLIASDGICTDTLTQNVTVNNAPQVSFTTSGATTGCAPFEVNFVNNTTGGGGNNYAWNFGDGGSSTAQNPSYTFAAPGTYTVTLSATLGSCSDADSIVNYITVFATPAAGFSTSPATVCLGDAINFTNTSTGASSYTWDFGDGSGTSTQQDPSYTYSTANTFTVTLISSDGVCADTISQSVSVNVAPQVSFTTSGATTGCGPLTVQFVNTTTGGGGNNYVWDFGDGSGTSTQQDPSHTYTSTGTFTVTLTATAGSCSDTDSLVNYITVNAAPTAAFTAGSVCLGEPVQFTNTSLGATSYLWDFGDGTSTSSLTNPTHVYSSGGTYTIVMVAYDGACSDTISQTVTVNPAPVVSFTASATTACDSLTVSFTNNTTGAASYVWDFGDGFTSTAVNPVHTYNVPGIYSVTLNGVLGICISSQTSVNLISIYETPQAIVSASQTVLCPNDCVNFTSTSTGSPTNWTWNFPGASTSISSAENPQNICYPNPGSYNVFLSVSNGHCNSSQQLVNFIVVNTCTTPVANFYSNDTTLCKGSCVNFTSTSQNASTFQWYFPGATPSSSTQPNPSNICYATSGSYDVTLIVSNGTTYDTLTIAGYIVVAPLPTPPTFSQNGDTLISSPAVTYQWYFGGFAISGATNQTYLALASGNYSVMITDSNGCSATSQQGWVSLSGVFDLDDPTLFYLYPNPTTSQFILFIQSSERRTIHLEMHDAIGREILRDDFSMTQSPFRKTFDASSLPAGVYFISVESSGSRIVRKLVKQ